jgi:hypothetical protein
MTVANDAPSEEDRELAMTQMAVDFLLRVKKAGWKFSFHHRSNLAGDAHFRLEVWHVGGFLASLTPAQMDALSQLSHEEDSVGGDVSGNTPHGDKPGRDPACAPDVSDKVPGMTPSPPLEEHQ